MGSSGRPTGITSIALGDVTEAGDRAVRPRARALIRSRVTTPSSQPVGPTTAATSGRATSATGPASNSATVMADGHDRRMRGS